LRNAVRRRNIASAASSALVLNGVLYVLDNVFIGFAACLAIGLTGHFIYDRRQRSAFIASLSPALRERLSGF
jgi:hypothetical protein